MRSRRIAASLILAASCTLAARAGAQQMRLAFPPSAADVAVSKDVPFGRADTLHLKMDLYRPPGATARATFIFFNRGVGADRRHPVYDGWARIAATRGLVAILPDLRSGHEAEDFEKLLSHITQNAATLGIDRDAIAVYAASGNVYTAFPIVEDSKQTAIKAAIMYYGTAEVTTFRLDLPVLYVRAGLDRPPVNREITTLAARAASQNAPLTLLNHPGGYHGFEIFNDDDVTRDVIEQTLTFVKRATAPSYQAALRRGLPEAAAAGNMLTGQYRQAADIYAELLRSRADDARLRLSYGEALLADAQYATACAEFEKLKGKGLGPRDLGLPAARACMQKGDADAAVAWLKTIPTRFLPSAVQTEAVFASLQSRADFRALFPPR